MSQQEIVSSTFEENTAEEKTVEAVQWKPNQRNNEPTKVKRIDYTQENGNPDGAVSLCFPFVHKNVRPEKVFAVMRRQVNMSKTLIIRISARSIWDSLSESTTSFAGTGTRPFSFTMLTGVSLGTLRSGRF